MQSIKKFTFDSVKKICLKYFRGDELAATTWMNKYAMKRNGEFIESSPDDMHKRMAREFARKELENSRKVENLSRYGQKRKKLDYDRIFEYFRDFRYIIPQGSVMASLGNDAIIASLSNCVVLPDVYDSYGGIMHADQQLVQLFKRRCGVGIDISNIRPAGVPVSNTAEVSVGAVSFMERFSNTTREVAQHGRRGALMITMDVRHPEIEKFVMVKQDLSKITGANISVKISDEFMEAVMRKKKFMLKYPIDSDSPVVVKEIDAIGLWDKIIKCAHKTAEPGIIFWDRQNKYSTSNIYPGYENITTNPCSEIAMQGGDSCRLMVINLFSFVNDPFTSKPCFDFEKFYEVVYEAQRLMDDLVDLELEAIEKILDKISKDPEPEYIKFVEKDIWEILYKSGKKGRRTGLGFTALADTFSGLGLKYDSNDAANILEKIMKKKCEAEFESSVDMAIERGKFECFDPKIEEKSEFVQMMKQELPDVYERMMKYGRRNISVSTVSPTGTTSILSQTSSGIEPVFMLEYKRRQKTNDNCKYVDSFGDSWKEFVVYHNGLKKWMDITGNSDITLSPYYKSTANDIDWQKRIEIQCIAQKYTTHSISSTINLPRDVSVERVREIYLNAWKNGLKGITVYREGSRDGVLVSKECKLDGSCKSCDS